MDQAQKAEGQESEANQQAAEADHAAPEPAGFLAVQLAGGELEGQQGGEQLLGRAEPPNRPGAAGVEDDLVEADQITVFGAMA